MTSRLDALFRTQMRHAETLDTRQGIRRQEQSGRRKKGEDKEQEEEQEDIWEDETTVSVTALKSFLEQLAGEARRKENEREGQGGNSEDIAQSARTQSGTASQTTAHTDKAGNESSAARGTAKAAPRADKQATQEAAHAYQRTYRATHAREEANIPPPDAIASITLSAEELRTIHTLIDDLRALSENGTEFLTIHKSENFLQSLVQAVKDAPQAK